MISPLNELLISILSLFQVQGMFCDHCPSDGRTDSEETWLFYPSLVLIFIFGYCEVTWLDEMVIQSSLL